MNNALTILVQKIWFINR